MFFERLCTHIEKSNIQLIEKVYINDNLVSACLFPSWFSIHFDSHLLEMFVCLFVFSHFCLFVGCFVFCSFGINWNKVRGGDGFAQVWDMSGFCNTMFGKREWEGRKRKTTESSLCDSCWYSYLTIT